MNLYLELIFILLVSHVIRSEDQCDTELVTESCMQIYNVPKHSVVCEPSNDVKNTLTSLTSQAEFLVENVTEITNRLNDLDPSVPKQLPVEVQQRLDFIDVIKQRQDTQNQVVTRIDRELDEAKRRLTDVESEERREVKRLIDQQFQLIRLSLDKANLSLHEEYIQRLTNTASDLMTRLEFLEGALQGKILNNSNEFNEKINNYHKISQVEITGLQTRLEELGNEYRQKVEQVEAQVLEEEKKVQENEDNVENLQVSLQNLREMYARDFSSITDVGNKLTELREQVISIETQQSTDATKTTELAGNLLTVTSSLADTKQQLGGCCDKADALRVDVDALKQRLNVFEHLMPRTLKIADCQDALKFYFPNSGVYTISPDLTPRPVQVYCQMKGEKGWTVIQRRFSGDVDFYRTWDEYVQGFGDVTKEYWLGLQHIHAMTSLRRYRLRVDLEDWDGNWVWEEYDNFRVDGEVSGYTLHISQPSGTAGDSFSYHNGMKFSTKDRENDHDMLENCAQITHGAWWYNACIHSNLNGRYYQKGEYDTNTNFGDGIVWQTYKITNLYSMKSTIMSIMPVD